MESTKCYIVAATYRSGSTLLCDTLAATGLAGEPKEFFHRLNMTPLAQENYLAFVRQTMAETATPNGVFGAKLLWHHVAYLCEHVREFPDFREKDLSSRDLLAALFSNPKYIRIRRSDTLAQAISYVKARQTGVFHHQRGAPRQNHQEPVYDAAAIAQALRKCRLDDLAWTAFFEGFGIAPYTVDYETFLTQREDTIRALLAFLDIDIPEPLDMPEAPLERTADRVNQEWRSRFLEERA